MNSTTDKELYTSVFLAGFLVLMVELIQIKLIAFFVGSISHFLAIPIALFGLALGSIGFHFMARERALEVVRTASVALYGVLVAQFLTFFWVANTFFDKIHVSVHLPSTVVGELIVYTLLFLPCYALIGALFSAAFSAGADKVGRLYCADLAGAALACFVTPTLFTFTDLPAVILVLLASALVLLVTMASSRRLKMRSLSRP